MLRQQSKLTKNDGNHERNKKNSTSLKLGTKYRRVIVERERGER
jgi:hypothetical protein